MLQEEGLDLSGPGLDRATILNTSFTSDFGSSFTLPSDLGQSSQETVGPVLSTELNVMFSHLYYSPQLKFNIS
jgi:hypothetical protein